ALPEETIPLTISGMTTGRIINWSYPDIMIVVSDDRFDRISKQIAPKLYVGYRVENEKTAKETTEALAQVSVPEAQMSSYYTEYRLGIENAAFNVFVLGDRKSTRLNSSHVKISYAVF